MYINAQIYKVIGSWRTRISHIHLYAFFPNLYFAWDESEIFLYMCAYLSTCVYKWAGMHTLVYEYTPQFRIFPDTCVVALVTFFSVNIIFLSHPLICWMYQGWDLVIFNF